MSLSLLSVKRARFHAMLSGGSGWRVLLVTEGQNTKQTPGRRWVTSHSHAVKLQE